MSIFLQLAFLIAVILLAAKAAGYVSVRLGQPSVLGELLVGILLGPSLLDLLHLPFIEGEKLGETIKELGELGVLLLMFIAGLELHLNELTRNTKVSALAGIMGVLAPVALGTGTGLLFGLGWEDRALSRTYAWRHLRQHFRPDIDGTEGAAHARGPGIVRGRRVRRCDDHSAVVDFPGGRYRRGQRSRHPVDSGEDDPLPGLLDRFRPVCTAQTGAYHAQAADQPEHTLFGDGYPAVLRRGCGSGRRDGCHHRLVPGRADVRPLRRKGTAGTGRFGLGLRFVRADLFRQYWVGRQRP